MKNLRNILTIILLLAGFNGYAQSANPNLEEALKKGLDLISTAKSAEDYLKSANYFERIAQVETKEWLPIYYAAYSKLIARIESADNVTKDLLWDKGLIEIEQAQNLSTENSEIYALKGYLEYMKLSIDPQSRLRYMGQSAASLEKAKSINPENPRIYLVRGQNTFFTPEAFGGGKAKAKPILETAAAKFAIFKPGNAAMPNWGAQRVEVLLAQCN